MSLLSYTSIRGGRDPEDARSTTTVVARVTDRRRWLWVERMTNRRRRRWIGRVIGRRRVSLNCLPHIFTFEK